MGETEIVQQGQDSSSRLICGRGTSEKTHPCQVLTHGRAAARSGNRLHESTDDDLEVLGLGGNVGVCSAVRAVYSEGVNQQSDLVRCRGLRKRVTRTCRVRHISCLGR